MNTHVIKKVISLNSKSLDELRALHQELLSEQPHTNASRRQLIPKIAYRLQELALGGLSDDTRDSLQQIANGAKPATVRPHTNLLPGTKICREYNGVMHEVEVTKTGFDYQGQPFRSLSAVARKITGTRWNGPKFFKLKKGR